MDLYSVYTVWLRDVTRIRRDKPQILGSLARPILWLLFLGAGLSPVFQRHTDDRREGDHHESLKERDRTSAHRFSDGDRTPRDRGCEHLF